MAQIACHECGRAKWVLESYWYQCSRANCGRIFCWKCVRTFGFRNLTAMVFSKVLRNKHDHNRTHLTQACPRCSSALMKIHDIYS